MCSGGRLMISYESALQRLLAQATTAGEETVGLTQAFGRVLARSLDSPMSLPSFDHAAMDGYALVAGSGLPAGSEHAIHGSLAAGDPPADSAGGAWEIMTGACLPPGLDAVIALERTELLQSRSDGKPARIRLTESLLPGRNVRVAGTDVSVGSAVMAAGTSIGAAQIMLLAALGVASVPVVRRPRVAIICTGKELQADPGQSLAPGRIHNSNGPYLVAELTAAGAQVTGYETVDDSASNYADALQRAMDAGAEVIISTGAVSMGRYDFVPEVLRTLKAETLFHKVAIRPGGPMLGARLSRGPVLLALPGTPMAVAVGLRFFVVPLLRVMAGQAPEKPLQARLLESLPSRRGLRHFLHARLSQDERCSLVAIVSSLQQPFRIHSFAHDDTWLVVPEDVVACETDMLFDVFSLGAAAPWPLGLTKREQAGGGQT
jgi:molybdopterin molybdotransferase